MNYEQAKTLTPEKSFVKFAGSDYRFAGLYSEGHMLQGVHLMIYDEPPSLHVDSINMSSCSMSERPAN
jgi:hypothetical protein